MRWGIVVVFPLALSCQSSSRVEPAAVDDPEPDAIYTDYLGGKFDEAGHPVGAFVLEGSSCNAETGWVYDGRVLAEPWFDDPGVLCAGETDALGAGLFAVNVRASIGTASGDAALLRVRVLSTTGTELAMREIAISEFDRPYAYQNFPVPLRVSASSAGPVRVELEWLGDQEMELEYIEVFRRDRQLVLEPLSGVLDTMESLRIEIVDPPSDAYVDLRCGDLDRTTELQTLIDSGSATVEDTEFRRIITAPIETLLEGCELPTRLVADLRRTDRDQRDLSARRADRVSRGRRSTARRADRVSPVPRGLEQRQLVARGRAGFRCRVGARGARDAGRVAGRVRHRRRVGRRHQRAL